MMTGNAPRVIAATVVILIIIGFGAYLLGKHFWPDPDPVSESPFASLLTKAGYKMLPFPDADLGPGAIVQVKKLEDGEQLEYVGHLSACSVPLELANPDSVLPLAIGSDVSSQYDANASLNVAGVKAGTKIDDVDRIGFEGESAGPERLELTKLSLWLTNPANKLPDSCGEWLAKENIAVVRDAFAVTAGKFSAFNKTSGRLALESSGPQYFEVDTGAEFSGEGVISFSSKVYVAVKHLRWMHGEFGNLGNAADDDKQVVPLTDIKQVIKPN